MPISHSLSNIGTTAVNLTSGLDSGFDITVQHTGTTGYIYLGGPGVTSSNYGFRLSAGQAFSVELSGKDDLFAIGSAADIPMAVLKASLEAGK